MGRSRSYLLNCTQTRCKAIGSGPGGRRCELLLRSEEELPPLPSQTTSMMILSLCGSRPDHSSSSVDSAGSRLVWNSFQGIVRGRTRWHDARELSGGWNREISSKMSKSSAQRIDHLSRNHLALLRLQTPVAPYPTRALGLPCSANANF